MVADRGPVEYGLAVDTISDQVELSGADCHLTIDPVAPAKEIVVPLPLQTVLVAAVADPPTEGELTCIVNWAAFADDGTAQSAVEVSWQSILSPLPKPLSV